MRETLLRVSRREQGASIQQFREGMGLMARWLVVGLFGLLAAGLLPGVASAGGCPNEQFRTGLGAGLPDCRAYEQVSPVDKNGGDVTPNISEHLFVSSTDGGRMSFASTQAYVDALTGAATVQFYVASRGASGWSSRSLLPSQRAEPFVMTGPVIAAFSSDLSSAILSSGGAGNGGHRGQDEPPLVSGEPPKNENLFVSDTSGNAYQLVDVTPAGVMPSGAEFDRATPDLSHVVFKEEAQLTPSASATTQNIFEWAGGAVSLVSALPGGGAASNASFDAVSEDGSRVVFTADDGNLYLHENGVPTVQIDASHGSGGGGAGGFGVASSDGSKVFFTDSAERGLTNDTVAGSGENLYEYDVAGATLTDLTPDVHAEVQGVVGAGSDGSYLYFVADGSLAAGATAGQPNLYLRHSGVTTFIATLKPGAELSDSGDGRDWGMRYRRSATVTPDGIRLAFDSLASLTGYDNRDATTGEPDTEVFLYDAVANHLVCASCNPSGDRPIGPSAIRELFSGLNLGPEESPPHYLYSDGNRLFFNSLDALSPQDSNGKEDVYEYEGGKVSLISSGTSGEFSEFADASASGDDAFFFTDQQLVAQDRDPQFDLYDARVGGGFPAPTVPASCVGESCRQSPVGAPVLGAPGSVTFAGDGNLTPAIAAPVLKPRPKAKKPKAKKRRRRAKAKKGARGSRRGIGSHSTGKRG